MDTREMWEQYFSPGVGPGDDEMLIQMLNELVLTIKWIERIYGPVRSQLMVRAMISDYQALYSMAWNRKLKDIPSL